jgi:hypothetical protein
MGYTPSNGAIGELAATAFRSAAETDSPAGVNVHPRIIGVRVIGPFKLALNFADGSEGTIDLWPLIVGRGGVFTPLQDPDFFARVDVDREAGTIVWPNGVDLDPDVLFEAARRPD